MVIWVANFVLLFLPLGCPEELHQNRQRVEPSQIRVFRDGEWHGKDEDNPAEF